MSRVPPPKTALIVVNYGSSALLTDNLVPVGTSVAQVVVVDCFTDDAERTRVARLCAEHGWTPVLLDDNVGFGGGVNAGAARAIADGAEVIATLNPDATIAPDALARLAAAACQTGVLVSPRIVTGAGATWSAGADLYLDDGTSAAIRRRAEFEGRPRREWATGACFAMATSTWTNLGGFDDDYFLYWEDIDLSHRLLDAGGRLVRLDDVTVVHDEGQTHGRAAGDRAKSPTYYYYNVRNRLLYAAKHLDDAAVRGWVRSSRSIGYQVLLQGGRRQLVTSFTPWRAYFRGLRDGKALVERLRPGIA